MLSTSVLSDQMLGNEGVFFSSTEVTNTYKSEHDEEWLVVQIHLCEQCQSQVDKDKVL